MPTVLIAALAAHPANTLTTIHNALTPLVPVSLGFLAFIGISTFVRRRRGEQDD